MSHLPLYDSFEETEKEICVLCTQSHDDPIELGEKINIDNIALHHFCAVRVDLLM